MSDDEKTEYDLQGEHAQAAYKLLAGLIVPRPIAWVTTLNEDGSVNAAPFSFFNVFGSKPPLVAFAPGDKSPGIPKDTARNLRRSGEFVVNLVDEAMAEAMNQTAAEFESGISEIDLVGLSTVASSTITVPRIAESPVSLECVEHSTLEIGKNRLVIGIGPRIHVRSGVIDPETLLVDSEAYHPIGRMQVPSAYCKTQDQFSMERP